MVPLLKLLIVLGTKYNVEILNNVVVNTILCPLITTKEIVYSKLKNENVTMYLQCLVAVLKLSQIHQADLKVSILNEKAVQYIVAMAIKCGNNEQRILALELLKAPDHFAPNATAEVIWYMILIDLIRPKWHFLCPCEQLISKTIFEPNELANGEVTVQSPSIMMISSTTVATNVRNNDNDNDFNRLYNAIQKACIENKFDKLPIFDFIKLYEDRIVVLNQRVAMLNNKLNELTKEITVEKHTSLRFETTIQKCTEMVKSLHRSNELYV